MPRTTQPIERWKRQFIRLLFHYSAKRTDPSAADRVKAPHVPLALYKFRQFSDQHKKALEDGVLWRTPPNRFNDPYDLIIHFDIGRFLIEDTSSERMIAAARRNNETDFRPQKLVNPVQQREWTQTFLETVLKDQPPEIIDVCRTTNAEHERKLQGEMVKFMSDTVRQGYSVVSFAGDATSVLMWSHYSQDHKGFSIEYNLAGTEFGRICYPVIYRRKLLDSTRYMFKRDPADFNNLFPIYACILKSDEWSYEQEWRVVLPAGIPYATSQIKMPKPAAIILGVLAEPTNESWMSDYCDRHSIPLKKMVQHRNEFRLEVGEPYHVPRSV